MSMNNVLVVHFLGSVVEAEVLEHKTVYRRVGGNYYIFQDGALHTDCSHFIDDFQAKELQAVAFRNYDALILNEQDPGFRFVALADVVETIDADEREENEHKAKFLEYAQEDDLL